MRLAELLRRPRLLLAAAILVQWLTTAVVAVRADDVSIGAIELVNVVVLGPVALVCAYRVAAAIAGAALGAWTLLVWVGAPWLLPVVTLDSYDAIVRDRVLPLALGLTPELGYPAGVALLVTVALLVGDAVASGLAAGVTTAVAVLLTPESVLFALPAAFALLASRRLKVLALFFAALTPVLLVALVWLEPSFEQLALDRLQGHSAGLREYFWSQRLLQWLPLAGVIAIARRSPWLAILIGGWFAAFLLAQATRAGVGFDDGELFRVLLPALPAYLLLAASLPLLVPTLASRLGPLARPASAP